MEAAGQKKKRKAFQVYTLRFTFLTLYVLRSLRFTFLTLYVSYTYPTPIRLSNHFIPLFFREGHSKQLIGRPSPEKEERRYAAPTRSPSPSRQSMDRPYAD